MKFTARVIRGEGLGRVIGFPTINLEIPDGLNLQDGVYACEVFCETGNFKGGLHFGYKKTVNPKMKTLEIHLKNFSGDLLGKNVSVQIGKYLRPIKKFASIKALVAQLKIDIASI